MNKGLEDTHTRMYKNDSKDMKNIFTIIVHQENVS